MLDPNDTCFGISPTAAKESSDSRFATTHWSTILAAGQTDHARASAALERLCQKYWYPVYAFIRRRGFDRPEAEDLAQAFFAQLLEKEALKKVDQEKGRFRAFLATALSNFLNSDWDRRTALRRGGAQEIVSLDALSAEELYGRESVPSLTPEVLFERRWAIALLEQVLARLKQEYVSSGKLPLFNTLEPALTALVAPGFYAQAAPGLGLRESAIKVALHRLRRRFGQLLRSEIAHTVAFPAEVDDEIRYLFAVIST